MKTYLLSTVALLFFATLTFGQGAGNYMINQKKSYSANNDVFISERSQEAQLGYYDQPAYQYQTYYTPPVSYYNDTVIQLSVSGIMNTEADSYIAIFGVSQTEETIESCHELINKRINAFIDDLAELGIKKEDVYIDFISQVPIFEYEVEKKLFSKTYNEIPAGFELKKNVHIKYKNKDIAEKLLIKAAQNEIYDIIKVEYIVENLDEVYDSLRNECIKIMNSKIEDYKKMGIVFGSMYKTVQESTYSYYPIQRYSSYASFNDYGSSAVNKDGKRIRRSANQVNIYYSKMPYNSYDLVINPDMVEPSVQLVYNVTMKFVLKKL